MTATETDRPTIDFTYTIRLNDGTEHAFTARLDQDTLDLVPDQVDEQPDWTRLEFNRCPNCSLPSTIERCPVAVNLVDLIAFFRDLKSHHEVDVFIETGPRNFSKRVPIQTVASSLMGIYMVTSGCPVLNKMRPMVELHLPFQTWEETTYRVISMYLMAQYFLKQKGREPDWDLEQLVAFFEDVYQVNNAFFKRLDSIEFREGDASLNAVSILNASINLAAMSIESQDLLHWERIFLAHWDGPA